MPAVTRSQPNPNTYCEFEFRLKNVCNQKLWDEYLQHVQDLIVKEEEVLKQNIAKLKADWDADAERRARFDAYFSQPKPHNSMACSEVKYAPADLSYHPDHAFHNLANDKQLQQDLYAKDFEYKFSNWPKQCWLKPRFETTSLKLVFDKIKLFQIMPYTYRSGNPSRRVEITVQVEIDFPKDHLHFGSSMMYLQLPHFPITPDGFNQDKVRDTIVTMLNWKLNNPPSDLEGMVVKKITKVEFCQTQ